MIEFTAFWAETGQLVEKVSTVQVLFGSCACKKSFCDMQHNYCIKQK